MPKETIYGDANQKTSDGDQINTIVAWDRFGTVQLAVAACDSSGDSLVPDDRENNNCGYWMQITDRKQINDLIRYLRRARDQAFGKDA